MAKQLYCSRCGNYQGEIEKGRIARNARIICEQCDDKHISDDLTEKSIRELVAPNKFKQTFNQVTA